MGVDMMTTHNNGGYNGGNRAGTSDTNRAVDMEPTGEAEQEALYADNLKDHAQPRPEAAAMRGAYSTITSAGGKRALASPGKIRPASDRAPGMATTSSHGRGGIREFTDSFGFDFAPGSVPIGAGEGGQGGHMSTLTRESPLLGKDPMDLGVLPLEKE